jgi:hypothetical protein
MAEAREWDGQSYDRISGPMEALGREVPDAEHFRDWRAPWNYAG